MEMIPNDDEKEYFNTIPATINAGKQSHLLNCFRKVGEMELSSSSAIQKVNLYVLNNNKFSFDYEGLINLIRNNLVNYVFNRKAYRQFVEGEELQSATIQAQRKLIAIQEGEETKNFGSGGELGEILLYIFFESFLHAPKLLSKVELKTNDNDYIKGFDGIHYKIKSYDKYNAYQIVYGEAKIKDDLKEAITDAFDSLKICFNRRETEFNLIDGKLLNEVVENEEQINILKKIFIPKYRDAGSDIETENAFGIFIGYTFEHLTDGNKLPKENIDTKIKSDLQSVKELIIKTIKTMPETDSDYHIFFLPFNNAVKDKHRIMQQIAGISINGTK